eukprot:SAG31_NODE_5426_length_2545_cov_2.943581_2_plen_39_part_00
MLSVVLRNVGDYDSTDGFIIEQKKLQDVQVCWAVLMLG